MHSTCKLDIRFCEENKVAMTNKCHCEQCWLCLVLQIGYQGKPTVAALITEVVNYENTKNRGSWREKKSCILKIASNFQQLVLPNEKITTPSLQDEKKSALIFPREIELTFDSSICPAWDSRVDLQYSLEFLPRPSDLHTPAIKKKKQVKKISSI